MVTRSVRYAGKQSIRAMFVERSPTRKFEKLLMLTLQIKATSERRPGLKKSAIPFTLLGRTMEARLHYLPRLKVLNGFTLLHSLRAVR